jgi:Mce-associated membrane protein
VALQHDTVTDGASATPSAGAARFRWGVLAVLMLLVLGSLGYLGHRVVADGTGGGAHRVASAFSAADPLQQQRDQVMSQARQFALRINHYGPDQLDAGKTTMSAYKTSVEQVVSAKFRADFEGNGLPLVEASVSQAGVKRTTQVYAVGVAAIDTDTATAMVAGSFTNAMPKKAGSATYVASEPEPYRFEVSLVKSGGTWLVDSFTPVEKPSGATDGVAQ